MTTSEGTAPDDTSTPSGRSRRARRSASGTAGTRRSRQPRLSGDDLVGQLSATVEQLIAENRELKRTLARVEKASAGAGLGDATRALSGLQRRVSRALSGDGAGRGRRRGADGTAAPVRARRKITDPEVLERRRAALAKARAARAAQRQAAAGG